MFLTLVWSGEGVGVVRYLVFGVGVCWHTKPNRDQEARSPPEVCRLRCRAYFFLSTQRCSGPALGLADSGEAGGLTLSQRAAVYTNAAERKTVRLDKHKTSLSLSFFL